MNGTYTREELQAMADRMRAVANAVYPMLRDCGCHPYIEFNGLMQKYVDICDRAAAQGIQFPFCSEHSGTPLPVEVHDMLYLAEKLRCIFGPILTSNPRAREAFRQALLGDYAYA